MTELESDLAKHWNEVYHKRDYQAGKQLFLEVVGIFSAGAVLFTALTVWIPGIGLPLSGYMVAKVMMEAAKQYSRLTVEQRKQIRCFIRVLNGGVSYFLLED
ncbi:MAG: hypothetical protein H3C47_14740 [Candidatus Cloacimonetes bacterium]|nr:hypothetical protein [Candidatus Cloacimonadota bacterium]